MPDQDNEMASEAPKAREDAMSVYVRLKHLEESVLRLFDMLSKTSQCDPRWLSIGRTHIEQGFMATRRAAFGVKGANVRVSLPGDGKIDEVTQAGKDAAAALKMFEEPRPVQALLRKRARQYGYNDAKRTWTDEHGVPVTRDGYYIDPPEPSKNND